ncbi:DUF1176 domain-containing protein [Sphingomonas sp. So64.6b]|uniref:DUF1176 domain-containing protein n=1 Tax=Sphingomonas sp. So64.6b TaxID=2997354 RepID=UPI0015FF0A20|nr:DUF1176 domain-containing protein [Sphingomonas sp. So64.6b]QNA86095.1 DUF1176 domain-containing protein [Sphingomonas sp. So64.6b]
MLTFAALALATAPSPSAPRPGELKTFKDWVVACDNGNSCSLASLDPVVGESHDATLNLTRDAGPEGGLRISLSAVIDGPAPAGLSIDGKPVGKAFKPAAHGVTLDGTGSMAVAALLGNSKALVVTDAGGKRIATLSPSGLTAALRHIDAVQGRDGGVTALVAKGAKPASAVPAAPILPMIIAMRPSGQAARPTAQQITALARSAKCNVDPTIPGKADAFALGAGKALVLVQCVAAVYNVSSAVFIIDNGKPRPARFDAPTGSGEATIVPLVLNAKYKAGTLTSYGKNRGLADCGTAQSFVWDGAKFRLSAQSDMDSCRGNTNFITTWRARVTRP